MKRHPIDNSILMIVDGYAFNVEDNDFGYGFTMLRFHTGSINGPFTEHNVFTLGRMTSTIGYQWSADPNNSNEYRFDCRLADPSLVILEDGSVLVGYRGTKCCCDEIIGTWGTCGEHEYESASYLRLEYPDDDSTLYSVNCIVLLYLKYILSIFGSGFEQP